MGDFIGGYVCGIVTLLCIFWICSIFIPNAHYRESFEGHDYIHCYGEKNFIHDPDCQCFDN